jgi:hypothetical protein
MRDVAVHEYGACVRRRVAGPIDPVPGAINLAQADLYKIFRKMPVPVGWAGTARTGGRSGGSSRLGCRRHGREAGRDSARRPPLAPVGLAAAADTPRTITRPSLVTTARRHGLTPGFRAAPCSPAVHVARPVAASSSRSPHQRRAVGASRSCSSGPIRRVNRSCNAEPGRTRDVAPRSCTRTTVSKPTTPSPVPPGGGRLRSASGSRALSTWVSVRTGRPVG